jgi:predicted Zn-dependent protease
MEFYKKIDRAVDALASFLTDSPNRRPIRISIYALLIFIAVGIPYSLIRHVQTSGFHVVSVEREKKVGDNVAKQLQKRMRLLPTDDNVTLYINSVGQNIARTNNPWRTDFRFYVVDDSRMINAFALPGGKIYITTGMLNKLDNEAELAAVLGHEIAHVSRRHYARNMGRQMLLSWIKKFLGGADTAIQEAGLFLTTNFAFLSMRQEDELEADYLGTLYIYEIDYDPSAGVTLTKKLLDIERKMPDFIKVMALTHPPSAERVDAMIKLKKSLPTKDGLRLGVEEYEKGIRPDKKALTEYDWYKKQIMEPFE